jgi:hypothetical protein
VEEAVILKEDVEIIKYAKRRDAWIAGVSEAVWTEYMLQTKIRNRCGNFSSLLTIHIRYSREHQYLR